MRGPLIGEAAARRAIALVAHVLRQPIDALWEMERRELAAWADEAQRLLWGLYARRER